jgi:hypothetical protein
VSDLQRLGNMSRHSIKTLLAGGALSSTFYAGGFEGTDLLPGLEFLIAGTLILVTCGLPLGVYLIFRKKKVVSFKRTTKVANLRDQNE